MSTLASFAVASREENAAVASVIVNVIDTRSVV